MKKRIFSILLAMSLLLCLLPRQAVLVSAAISLKCGANVTCTWDKTTGEVRFSGSGSMYDNILYYGDMAYTEWWSWTPELVKTVYIEDGITSIGNFAFYECSQLTEITIPDSVSSIGKYAFYRCVRLTDIHIPNSVATIGESAFWGCTGLTEVSLSEGLTSIGSEAFFSCSGLTDIVLPDSVVYMGSGVFSKCSRLTDVTLSNCLPVVEEGTFSGCTALTEMTLPDSVISVGGVAFSGCTNLVDITIPDSVTSIGVSAFWRCTALTEITLPEGLTSIGSSAFSDCTSLIGVNIPDSVNSIGTDVFNNTPYYKDESRWENGVLYLGKNLVEAKTDLTGSYEIKDGTKTISNSAFYGCTGLTEVTIPDSVITIGEMAFYGCVALSKVRLPNRIFSIEEGTFEGCSTLKEITIPDSVTSIGGSTFRNCSALTEITVPHSVAVVGNYAFYNCIGLNDVIIEDGVTTIGNYAFYGCTELSRIRIPDSVTDIGMYAFAATSYYKDESNWEDDVLYLGNHLIEAKESVRGSYEVKAGTVSISSYAFYNCTELNEISLPDSVLSIGASAFECCTGLVRANIGKGVTIIGMWAFSDCGSLSEISLPDSVLSIEMEAFCGCTGLTEIAVPDNVTTIGGNVFYGCTNLTEITLPDRRIKMPNNAFADTGYYNDSNHWEDGMLYIGNHLIEIRSDKSGECVVRDGTVTIASGAFVGGGMHITSIAIPDTMIYVANDIISDGPQFYHPNVFPKLEKVEISDLGAWSRIEFGSAESNPLYYAGELYLNGEQVKGLTILEGATSVGDYAFCNCYGLTGVILADSVASVGKGAFMECNVLDAVYVLNPDCSIDPTSMTFRAPTATRIYGHGDSESRKYSNEFGYSFGELCNCTGDTGNYRVETVDSTCTIEGGVQYVCMDCRSSLIIEGRPATGHSYTVYRNDGEEHTVSCSRCDDSYKESHAYADGYCVCGAEYTESSILDESIVIGHSLNLASDISVNYVVPAFLLDSYEEYYLKCFLPIYNGNDRSGTKIICVEPVHKGQYYYFTLKGITAVQIGDEIKVCLQMTKDGVSYMSQSDHYSVAAYAYGQLKKDTTTANLKTLCADLLVYGAAAQTYKGYRTDALCDMAMTPEQRAYCSDTEAVTFNSNNFTLDDVQDGRITWLGKALNLESKVVIKFIMETAAYSGNVEDLTLRVTYTDHNGQEQTVIVTEPTYYGSNTRYSFDFDGLLAAELRTVVKVAVFAGEKQVSSTMCYSADTYGNHVTGNLRKLCQALFAYSDSAKAFFG